MDHTQSWKNFALGKEIDIAGAFIFNGLQRLHELETLHYESEIFEVLYNLSVGIERLLKVCVILIEHDEVTDQDAFEKSLITHTHQDLLQRIRAKHSLNLMGTHNEFLDLLSKFYNTHRYGRYTMSAAVYTGSEKQMLHRYIEKHLDITIADEFPFQITHLDDRIRKFVGKKVGKIAELLYELICTEARRLNIFTNELRVDSKAEKIFIRKSYDFLDEDVLWKELLIFFVNAEPNSKNHELLKKIEPLDFDPALAPEYLAAR